MACPRRSSSRARSTGSPIRRSSCARIRHDYNPAPNVGAVWNPDKPTGVLGSILGKGVYRANS